MSHLAAQISLVSVERGDDRLGVLAAERLAVDRRIAHVGGRLDLRNRHRHAGQFWIAQVAAAKHIGQRMAQHLADSQLALRRTGVRTGMMTRHSILALSCFDKLSMRSWIGSSS